MSEKFVIKPELKSKLDRMCWELVNKWVLFGMKYEKVSEEDLYERGKLNEAEAMTKMYDFVSNGKYILVRRKNGED
mgnify:CR=1 FL=1